MIRAKTPPGVAPSGPSRGAVSERRADPPPAFAKFNSVLKVAQQQAEAPRPGLIARIPNEPGHQRCGVGPERSPTGGTQIKRMVSPIRSSHLQSVPVVMTTNGSAVSPPSLLTAPKRELIVRTTSKELQVLTLGSKCTSPSNASMQGSTNCPLSMARSPASSPVHTPRSGTTGGLGAALAEATCNVSCNMSESAETLPPQGFQQQAGRLPLAKVCYPQGGLDSVGKQTIRGSSDAPPGTLSSSMPVLPGREQAMAKAGAKLDASPSKQSTASTELCATEQVTSLGAAVDSCNQRPAAAERVDREDVCSAIERLRARTSAQLKSRTVSQGNTTCPQEALDRSTMAAKEMSEASDIESAGLQKQIADLQAAFQGCSTGQASVTATLGKLETRLNKGLESIADVAQARMATDSATDAMLGALRKCVDELNEQCKWPPGGSAPTLADAVRQQSEQLLQHDAQLRQQDIQIKEMEVMHEKTQGQLSLRMSAWEVELEEVRAAIGSAAAGSLQNSANVVDQIAELEKTQADIASLLEEREELHTNFRTSLCSHAGEIDTLKASCNNHEAIFEAVFPKYDSEIQAMRMEQAQHASAIQRFAHLEADLQESGIKQANYKEDFDVVTSQLTSMHESQKQQVDYLQHDLAQVSGSLRASDAKHDELRSACGQIEESLQDFSQTLAATAERQGTESEATDSKLGELQERLVAEQDEAVQQIAQTLFDMKDTLQTRLGNVEGAVGSITQAMNDQQELFHQELSASLAKLGQSPSDRNAARAEAGVQDLEGRFHRLVEILEQTLGDFGAGKQGESGRRATVRDRLEEIEAAVGISARRPSVSSAEMPGAQEAAELSMSKTPSSAVQIPSPRWWMNEPLSLSVHRFGGDYPSSLQTAPSLHASMGGMGGLCTAPSLGNPDRLIRRQQGSACIP